MSRVRVLLVEDDQDDEFLVFAALRQGGVQAEIWRVETPEQLQQALAERQFDVGIADYSLPRLTGNQALEIIQDSGCDLPVIMVSGSVSEEVVVQTVKAGARDYLMKPNLTRLAVAVQREIEEAAERRHSRSLQEQLRHAQRLESLGVLAGGVAHDFNNILTGILGSASLATDILAPGSDAHRLIESVVAAAQHAAVLTRQLLAYAGKGQFFIEPIDLSATVRDSLRLLRLSVARNIEIDTQLDDRLPDIAADRDQIEQMLVNLIVNAAEAIGTHRDGHILIRTRQVELTQPVVPGNVAGESVAPGSYVSLEVADDGPGISGEVQARMFDPFFSTRFTGRGLGLSAVVGIVRTQRGALQVKSAPGEGATFTAHFPIANGHAKSNPSPAPVLEMLDGTAMVLEDEELVRKTVKTVLEQHGMKVFTAENGPAGIEALRVLADEVTAVVLDLKPSMNGDSVLGAIRQILPNVPVVVSSGYSEQDVRSQLSDPADVLFLQKPYGSVKLIRAMREALRATENGAPPGGAV